MNDPPKVLYDLQVEETTFDNGDHAIRARARVYEVDGSTAGKGLLVMPAGQHYVDQTMIAGKVIEATMAQLGPEEGAMAVAQMLNFHRERLSRQVMYAISNPNTQPTDASY